MFLIPALLATVCDTLVLYLPQEYPDHHAIWYHGYIYLSYFATARLLTLLPLSYHTTTGTRLKFPYGYYALHLISAVVMIIQMIHLAFTSNESSHSSSPLHDTGEVLDDIRNNEDMLGIRMARMLAIQLEKHLKNGNDDDDVNQMKIIWVLLILSVTSLFLHVLILFHVRSSAPAPNPHYSAYSGKNKKHLAYFVINQYNQQQLNSNAKNSLNGNNTNSVASYLLFNENRSNSDNPEQVGFLCDNSHDEEEEKKSFARTDDLLFSPSSTSSPMRGGQKRFTESFIHNVDEFMADFRIRFEQAKHQWRYRLDEVSKRIIQNQIGHSGNNPSAFLGFHNNLTPFRAMLQLYAYEEVFLNQKLDWAFPDNREGREALCFYAPQLLSFLLHGAFINSVELEQWLLDRCRSNLHFAHQCYWFLKAWCLGHAFIEVGPSGLEKTFPSSNALPDVDDLTDTNHPFNVRRVISEPDLGKDSSLIMQDEEAMSASEWEKKGSKYRVEEHIVVERLVLKIMEIGSEAATRLQYGRKKSNDYQETEAVDTALVDESYSDHNGYIPVDHKTGLPSQRHLVAATGNRIYGFLPVSSFPEQLTNFETSQLFLQTPNFLDSLLKVADDLFELPRSKRTYALRERLREIEIEQLPSNVLYLPVNNSMHRVWRIVSSESIAISTKERVPCIICLEVVDYEEEYDMDAQQQLNRRSLSDGGERNFFEKVNVSKGNSILTNWYKVARPPQRHSTLLGKVTNLTQKSLRRLRDDIEDTISLQNEKIFGGTNDSWKEFLGPSVMWKQEKSQSRSDSLIGTEMVAPLVHHDVESLTRVPVHLASEDVRNELEGSSQPKTIVKKKSGPGLPRPEKSNYTLPQFSSTDSLVSTESESLLGLSKTTPSPLIASSVASSRGSSRPESPVSTMGQWLSPVSDPKSNVDDIVNDVFFDEPEEGSYNIQPQRQIISERESVQPSSENKDATNFKKVNSIMRVGQQGIKKRVTQSNFDSSKHYGATKEENDGSTSNNALSPSYPLSSPKENENNREKNINTSRKKERNNSTKPPPVVFKEDWSTKQERIRSESAYGKHPKWRLLPILIKSNDDLRQEQLASQLIHQMALILAHAKSQAWLYPYEIIALTENGGIIEAIPDTISLDSLKKNDPDFTSLEDFFERHFGKPGTDEHANAKANFVESLAAYSIVCFLLQIKDRHNGNILLDNKGHLIHIDFGFFFLSSPGKNSGFESAPFKLTRDFVNLMDGPDSITFKKFRELCCRTFLDLRKNCYQITILLEMIMEGNEDLNCFRGRPQDALHGLQERFRLDLSDRACVDYVNSLINDSLENWRTRWYDRYQRFCVGVM